MLSRAVECCPTNVEVRCILCFLTLKFHCRHFIRCILTELGGVVYILLFNGCVKFCAKMCTHCPHLCGTALAWRWGLWAPRILQIPLFMNPKGRRLLRVPQFGPQNPAMGVLKSPGTPYRACVRRAFWRYHHLRAFSGVDTGAPGIKSDWCIYGIRAVYGCLAV